MEFKRPQFILRWLVVVIGPAVAVVILSSVYAKHYNRGLSFQQGLHVFGFMIDVPQVAAGCVLAALVSLCSLLRASHQRRRILFAGAVVAAAVCFSCALASCHVMALGFQRGRDRAYRNLDTTAIAQACRECQAGATSTTRPSLPLYYDAGAEAYKQLPLAIRSLGPKSVIVGSRGVVIWLDGGGPAAHEGVFVPLEELHTSVEAYARRHTLTTLATRPPVFKFYLDDCRSLPYE